MFDQDVANPFLNGTIDLEDEAMRGDSDILIIDDKKIDEMLEPEDNHV